MPAPKDYLRMRSGLMHAQRAPHALCHINRSVASGEAVATSDSTQTQCPRSRRLLPVMLVLRAQAQCPRSRRLPLVTLALSWADFFGPLFGLRVWWAYMA